jgi:hypothetical protein
LYTSPDLIAWTPQTLPATVSGSTAAFGGGTFVICSLGNTQAFFFTSANGTTWTQATESFTLLGSVKANPSLFYDGTHFVGTRGDGAVLVSADGQVWSGYDPVLPQPLTAISPAASGYLGIGSSGLLSTHANY